MYICRCLIPEIMKKLIFTLLGVFLFASMEAQDSFYGERIDDKDAISMSELLTELEGKESLQTKVEGKVLECCQTKGCWMKVDVGDGSSMQVKFKDYGFFVPKNSSGKTAVMQGIVKVETTSVAERKHYAEDAGKSKEEIDKISKPKKQLVFVASGVLLKD